MKELNMVILFVMCYVGVYVIFVVLFGFVLLVGACFVLVCVFVSKPVCCLTSCW